MNIGSKGYRFTLFTCAALFGLIALVIATVVIPPVQTDTFPLATPERATTAFWVSTILHLIVGIVLFFIALRFSNSSSGKSGVLGLLGGLSILFALALVDAATAFREHGPALATATTSLFMCAATEFLAGVLLIIIAVLLRKLK